MRHKPQIFGIVLASVLATLPTSAAGDEHYLLRGTGGRLDWSEANHLLVLDRNVFSNGFARIWTMDAEGQNLRCLTCKNLNLPTKHQGNPAWHPSGKYIVFQAVDPQLGGPLAKTSLHKLFTSPGSGVQNNLWIMTQDGERVWQITHLGKDEGILHPHFSYHGSKLIWAQRLNNEGGMGRWVIKMASFAEGAADVSVTDITTLTPGNLFFYETHGFSPDGTEIIFTGMPTGGGCADFDIYTYNLQSHQLRCLTDPKLRQWDEHAHFTPDGKRIVWMSSMGNPQTPSKLNQIQVKTDFWIMNSDGSQKQQISFFNAPPAVRSKKPRVIASDLSISGDGRSIFGYIQDPGTMLRPGSVVRIGLPSSGVSSILRAGRTTDSVVGFR